MPGVRKNLLHGCSRPLAAFGFLEAWLQKGFQLPQSLLLRQRLVLRQGWQGSLQQCIP